MNTTPIVYKRNFINKVICRLDFPPILKIKSELPALLQDAIRSNYPEYKRQVEFSVNIELSIDQAAQPAQVTEKEPRYLFENKAGNELVTLSSGFIALTFIGCYQHFPPFISRLDFIRKAFEDIYKPSGYKRIGLRYINQINLKGGKAFDWKGYINNNLISIIQGFVKNKSEITRSMHILHLLKDPHKITFQFGMHNPIFPNKIIKRQFILDYDCRADQDTPCDGITPMLTQFNNEIYEMFEDSIGKKLRAIMTKGEE